MLEPFIDEYKPFFYAKVVQFVYAIGFFGEQLACIMVCYSLFTVPYPFFVVYIISTIVNKLGNEYLNGFFTRESAVYTQKILRNR